MSDEDERQTSTNCNSLNDASSRRLYVIKSKLQGLTREKTKYNVEKLTQDVEFLHSEIGHLSHAVAETNKAINAQTAIRLNLNTQLAILRSNSRVRYTSLQRALQEKEVYEEELQKPNKTPAYRDLAQQKINTIVECLPQLHKQEEYNQALQTAEDAQTIARNKRDAFVENLNAKTRKLTEAKQLLHDSATRLPELEQAIEDLRLEREQTFNTASGKKQRRPPSPSLQKPVESPEQSLASLEQDTLEYEKQQCNNQLEKIRLLLKYFYEKMSEHNVSIISTPCSTPTTELISPLYHPLTPLEERTILSSFMDEQTSGNSASRKSSATAAQLSIAIAMKLPRNFSPLDLQSTITTNEIIHSPCHPENSFEFKKELPSDIVDKYAGGSKKKQQHVIHGKKSKKNKKGFGVKHSSQMITLYNDVRASTGSSDTLPAMPMFEFELGSTVKALQFMEQSVESYLNELSQRYPEQLSLPSDEQRSDILDADDIQDSALDTYSEASSFIEPSHISKDPILAVPLLTNIPEARSSSSSDDKKTVVSNSSPPSSHHSHSKAEQHPPSSIALLSPVEELPPLTIQIAQIERQVSDEGYRSVRNETQLHQTAGTNHNKLPLLTRSSSYDCTEKVDKWLSSTTPPFSVSSIEPTISDDFQATDNDDENLVQ